MQKPVLIELTAKDIKLMELIALIVLFLFLAFGLAGMYLSLTLGFTLFAFAGLAFLGFIAVRIYRWWRHG